MVIYKQILYSSLLSYTVKKPTVFLSYRRKNARELARYVHAKLTAYGADVFLDVETLNAVRFASVIEKEIIKRDYFLILLKPDTLDPDSWVRKEVEIALRHQKPIVPLIADGFDFSLHVPADLATLKEYGGIPYSDHYAEEAIARVAKAVGLRRSLLKRLGDFLSQNWWAGVGGIATIAALIVAIMALNPSPVPPVPTATPTQTLTPTETDSATGVPTQTPPASACEVDAFSISPDAQSLPAGTLLSLYGQGHCRGGVYASRFTIDGDSFGEDAGYVEQNETWRLTEGEQTICFEIAPGEWETGARECRTVVGVAPTETPVVASIQVESATIDELARELVLQVQIQNQHLATGYDAIFIDLTTEEQVAQFTVAVQDNVIRIPIGSIANGLYNIDVRVLNDDSSKIVNYTIQRFSLELPATATPSPTPSLTPTPTATAVVTQVQRRCVAVSRQAVNLRDGPGFANDVIYSLAAGAVMQVVWRDSRNEWIYVISSGQVGWVLLNYVQLQAECDTIPLVPSVPTATATVTAASGSSGVTSYPCEAQIVSRSAALLDRVYASPSTGAAHRLPVEQGINVFILQRVVNRPDDVWYEIEHLDHNYIGWISAEYITTSSQCS